MFEPMPGADDAGLRTGDGMTSATIRYVVTDSDYPPGWDSFLRKAHRDVERGTKYVFYRDCTQFSQREVEYLHRMIDSALEISRRTFLKHCPSSLATFRSLGYSRGGRASASDWHISYHRSKLKGERVYYFIWSSIEFLFLPEGSTLEL